MKYALLIQPEAVLLNVHASCRRGCSARNIENGVMLKISATHTTATVIQGARVGIASGVIREMGVPVRLWF